ncbi:MAG: putative DNA modification/repair radical SAM protein [Candidatus Margulisbacteria bacterium]|jgi:putative DNA modification/repair radical SAM protein|nr:putative DNA modification/repair radical SAM protein [Candidatus Margulisiibacteriota bacterium]
MDLQEKIKILSGAARYDVSCASCGVSRAVSREVSRLAGQGLGSTVSAGICHSWSDDGRCVSLLKVLLTNYCIYDCAYCINRRSNDVPRAAFTPEELIDLTIQFYKRNYIEGLFLSSGVLQSPDHTMEQLIRVARTLREKQNYYGYIHLKIIPGASPELVRLAGRYADRLSTNIELPSAPSLRLLAPDKQPQVIARTMQAVAAVAPAAGQSTQLIVGATPERDLQIVSLSERLYRAHNLSRVYYSGYVPVNADKRLPALLEEPAAAAEKNRLIKLREHRLYQADWLLRFYKFSAAEILSPEYPDLDEFVDPKTAWALRHPEFFPVEINKAGYAALLRIPGIGVRSAKRIMQARRFHALQDKALQRIGVVWKRARYFIVCGGRLPDGAARSSPAALYRFLAAGPKQKLLPGQEQLALFAA